jgi:hypothetical protein
MVLPFFQAGYVYTLPESPRWLLLQAHKDGNSKKHQYYEEAFLSFRKLRHSNIQAARDIFLIHHQLLIEKKMWDKQDEKGRKRGIAKWFRRLKELFSRRRNARAVFASLIVMLFQQFCGVNIVVYYSATIFQKAAFSTQKSLLVRIYQFTFTMHGWGTHAKRSSSCPLVLGSSTSSLQSRLYIGSTKLVDGRYSFGRFHLWRCSIFF